VRNVNNKWVFLLLGVILGVYVVPAIRAKASA
jgi:hypothetical protein